MVKIKDNVVRMEAPVIMVPDEQDREIPVLMNRHYITWITEHAKKKEIKYTRLSVKR
jgi:hypothetical protein